MFFMIVVFGVIGLIVGSLLWGVYDSGVIEVGLEFKRMSNAYYQLGIGFNRYDGEEIYTEELIIGLFFVNIVILFHKEN